MRKKGFLNLKLILIVLVIVILVIGAVFYIKNNLHEQELQSLSTTMLQIQAKAKVINERNKVNNTSDYIGKEISEEDLSFGPNIRVEGNEITGLDEDDRTVEKLLENIIISDKYVIKIIDKNGKNLQGQDLVGTGSKVQIFVNNPLDTQEVLICEYSIIVYGDIDGNGKINSVDLLKLQRHILGIEEIDFVAQKAGNINKNGKNPTSLDLLLIQRHILGLKLIEQ